MQEARLLPPRSLAHDLEAQQSDDGSLSEGQQDFLPASDDQDSDFALSQAQARLAGIQDQARGFERSSGLF